MNVPSWISRALVLMTFVAAPACCRGDDEPACERRLVRMATTTSTENSGLLGALLPPFTASTGVAVQVVAVGTGKAIRHGERGDVDVILVHAKAAEERFVEAGFGVNRRDVMHNDFVLVGPPTDPARIEGGHDAAAALTAIARARAPFVSRGDESGTHKKETALWRDAGVTPDGEWYMAAGQGMGAVLTMADEQQAYTLTDRGTWLALRARSPLKLLLEGDGRLFNPYGVIAVNPARHAHVNYVDAMSLIGWLTSPRGQGIIADFKQEGEALFHPDAAPPSRPLP